MRNLRWGNDAGLSGLALKVITGVLVGRRQREIQVRWKRQYVAETDSGVLCFEDGGAPFLAYELNKKFSRHEIVLQWELLAHGILSK